MRDIGHLGPSGVKVYLTALGTTLLMTLRYRGQGTNTTALEMKQKCIHRKQRSLIYTTNIMWVWGGGQYFSFMIKHALLYIVLPVVFFGSYSQAEFHL